MDQTLSRREILHILGASGLAAGAGTLRSVEAAPAEPPAADKHLAAVVVGGKVVQPQRELPVLRRTDVLVVGAGPAGITAALAARRVGVDVTLVERYGHFGGGWTGGLSLLVDGMFAKGNKQVTRGIGEEILGRLDKMDRAIINRQPGAYPIVDAEALKYLMVEMIVEAGITVYLHSWCVDAVMEGNVVKGAVFESKSGRQAILAKVVVDATGDGDVFAHAGAEYEVMRHNIGLLCRIGNLDKVDAAKAKQSTKVLPKLSNPTPIAGVNYVNMSGPEGNGLDVTELTKLELSHRRQIWRSVQQMRQTPGYEQVYLVDTAHQLGVRISRLLTGLKRLTYEDLKGRPKSSDCVGVSSGPDGAQHELQIPYGALVPMRVDNLLAAGRCISAEPKVADMIRCIPPCWVTGQAAGAAAALAVRDSCSPRDVDAAKLQKVLKGQDVYLG